jgi:hypothetical protein
MSSFCTTSTSLTDSDLSSLYGNNITHGILSSEPYPASDRETNGLLKESTLQQIVTSLSSQGVIPVYTDKIKPDDFLNKQKAFLTNTKKEYCFYESRYKYALEKLLNAIQQGYINNNGNSQQVIQTYLQHTQLLNQKLNDLTQIVNTITEKTLTNSSKITNDIQKFNETIQDKQKKLQEQNKILSSQQSTMILNKEMVKFTEEKARYTNNLLKLYSVMNIVALGLLIYVYRSASE